MNYIGIAQIVISILLIAAILMQTRGAALSNVFGGEGGALYHTRRGFEKVLFISTIVLAIFFVGLGVANLFVH